MHIALACNRPPRQASADLPEDEFEEFDSPETVGAIAGAIESLGHTVVPLEADPTFPESLARGGFDFVFNIAEGLKGRCREAQVPAVCDMLDIPYSGSDAITMGITLDKQLAKLAVAGEVPVAQGKVFRTTSQIDFTGMSFPVFIKPNAEGSSKGIRNTSRATDPAAAKEMVTRLLTDYQGSVLVEEFLPGEECTVGILGNEKPRAIGIMGISPKTTSLEDFVYSLETKRDYLNQVEYHIPPRLSEKTLWRIEATALKAYQLLECRDFARIDIRLNSANVPCFIEANPLPGLSPVKSDLVILSRATGFEYRDLIKEILTQAFTRCGLPH